MVGINIVKHSDIHIIMVFSVSVATHGHKEHQCSPVLHRLGHRSRCPESLALGRFLSMTTDAFKPMLVTVAPVFPGSAAEYCLFTLLQVSLCGHGIARVLLLG